MKEDTSYVLYICKTGLYLSIKNEQIAAYDLMVTICNAENTNLNM